MYEEKAGARNHKTAADKRKRKGAEKENDRGMSQMTTERDRAKRE